MAVGRKTEQNKFQPEIALRQKMLGDFPFDYVISDCDVD